MHRWSLTLDRNGLCTPRATSRASARSLCSTAVGLLTFAVILFGSLPAGAQPQSPVLTVAQLRKDPHLTPERFARCFRDFQFKLGDVRQAPDAFLAARAGDCDDFACLAAQILGEKNYTTKLVAVFMNGQTHVVCYVDEIHGYLDYNLRKAASPIQPANGNLEDIADKVAAYFRNPWRSASEFRYDGTEPRFGQIVFASTAKAPQPAPQPAPVVQQAAAPSCPKPVLATAAPAGL